MANNKPKYWTVGQIDATGVRGPHEKELEDISNSKYNLFIDIDETKLKSIVGEELGGKIEDIDFGEDWTITMEMFPEVNIHLSYSYFGDEFGDGIEAEFKFLFSGERAHWVPGEDSVTYVDIIMDFLERQIKSEKPFEKNFEEKTDLMEKVLVQRREPFKFLTENDIEHLERFIDGKVEKVTDGWKITRELFPQIFTDIIWDRENGLDIKFYGDKLENNIGSYHIELVGIFTINHILRYITMKYYETEDLPDICYIMFSRMITKQMDWEHRRA